MFLDIETTGLSHFYDEITVVGWSFAGKMNTLVKGQNPGAFFDDAARARVLVTFNGIRFDTKFIFKELPGIRLPEDHLDLMYVCRQGQILLDARMSLLFVVFWRCARVAG